MALLYYHINKVPITRQWKQVDQNGITSMKKENALKIQPLMGTPLITKGSWERNESMDDNSRGTLLRY